MAPKNKPKDDNQTLFGLDHNEDKNTSLASAQDQTLLKALQDLIIRVVNPEEINDMNKTHLGPEATKLITALQEFVSSIVGRSQSSAQNVIKVELDDEEEELRVDAHDDDREEGHQLSETPSFELDGGMIMNKNSADLDVLQNPRPIFGEKLLEALREHIFNKMPIRLLSFEPNGFNLQISLLDRGALFARLALILQEKMYKEKFQPKKRRHNMETDQEVIERLIAKYTKYAILSHTWLRTASGSEVTYADWNRGVLNSNDPGYRKLVNFCKVAWKDHRLAFGWMDSVCINKDSSSELDESIRSMYNWYERAEICIVYLAETATVSDMTSDRWFTRGWTLQELLAPPVIKFYNSHWKRLIQHSYNDKGVTEVTQQIERTTTISKEELVAIRTAPISRRMQLAATRVVTREEDTAYSLMGIFNVSFSTAYGEGAPRAFFRLLQEILLCSEHALDILNWAGRVGPRPHTSFILPGSALNYINRSSNKGLMLENSYPIEPLTFSHMGLRVPVILMPAISIQSRRIPVGAYSATANISPVGYSSDFPTTYDLLDTRVSGKDGWKEDNDWYQMTFAVVNFSAISDGSIIRLPKTCLAFGLWCDEPAGKISPMGNFSFIRTHEPIVFELSNRTRVDKNRDQLQDELSEWYWLAKRDELANHGMQLFTMYR